jgi:dipeptidase E
MSLAPPPGRRLLLISNSTLHGSGYLDHAETEIRGVLAEAPPVLFISYALFDRDAYAELARERFEEMGLHLEGIHRTSDPQRAVSQAQALFVGGGNTFRLLKILQELSLLEPIRRRVLQGMPYIGSSAGSVIAAPTIRTTNDMPIVEPSSFEALSLVSFQINAHYLDPDPASTHMGETREERIRQFHEENLAPVVGLREGTMLRIEGESIRLRGARPARIFRRGQDPLEVPPDNFLEKILEA